MLTVRLNAEIEQRLAALVKRIGRTKTYYVREAILQYMDDLEEASLAVKRLENAGKRWTQMELEQGLDR